jgi:hypothetical protein
LSPNLSVLGIWYLVFSRKLAAVHVSHAALYLPNRAKY